MGAHELAELVSLGATVPTVALAIAVVYRWGVPALAAFQKVKRSAEDWFIIGVAAGFCGAVLDNLYWAIPWTLDYMDHPSSGAWMSSGVYFNIFFRQGLGIYAGYCHVKASEVALSSKDRWLNRLMAGAVCLGVVASITLAGVTMYGGF